MRRSFLDGLRGVALVFMVVNHTGRWWMDGTMGWGRYWLIYATMLVAAPLFLFLVGFCLALSLHRAAEVEGYGAVALARKYAGRGARIVLAGLLLNLLVFPEDPVVSGGVLQTIGFSILLLAPLGALLRHAAWRWTLLAGAVALYAGFVVAHPALTRFVVAHPAFSQAMLFDFPLWPWIAVPLVGLVLGRLELDRADEPARRRFYTTLAGLGLAIMVAVLAWEDTLGTAPAQGFKRDLVLNNHWTPAPLTALWIVGMIFFALAAARWLMEVRGLRAPRLVVFGRTAFMLYFVHQLIVFTLVKNALGVTMNDWPIFTVANIALLVVLGGLARVWLDVRGPVRQRAAEAGALVRRVIARREAA